MLDVSKDFPFLQRTVGGKRIIYLDSAATTQKPQCVIDKVSTVYRNGISNVHRALNFLADEVTVEFENARESVARFIGCSKNEIILTGNATQGLNLVATWLGGESKPKVLTTTLEHHSNLVPWLDKSNVEFVDWAENGQIDLEDLKKKLAKNPDLFSIAWCSNLLGTVQPMERIMELCREAGVKTLVDASQSIPHIPCDVGQLGCDYMVFSSHKIYGPSGIGVLYVRSSELENLSPVFLGGSMVKEVHCDGYTLNDLPYRFEAGTPNIEGLIGLGEALEYVLDLGYEEIHTHESNLITYAKNCLSEIKEVTLLGPRPQEPSAPLAAFLVDGLESTAVAKILSNRANIVMRSGFHCAQPAHDQLSCQPSCRISLAVYNNYEDIDEFITTLKLCISGV